MVLLMLLALAFGGAALFFLVLVGLFEAPWPLLLAGLLLAFFGLQRLSAQSDAEMAESEMPQLSVVKGSPRASTQSNQPSLTSSKGADSPARPMAEELVYRGIPYTHIEPGASPEGSPDTSVVLEGTYRGKQWKAKQQSQERASTARKLSDEIVYRGRKVKKIPPNPS
ncbi:hypothetical protein C7271_03490 [filamentous cyanobacterium CCP5]|nr:hypothetical protein C7271_03490 [filamentous cyanobacterium CCP5]